MSDPDDPWNQVAIAAKAVAESNAPLCSLCRRVVVLTEHGAMKVHFADVRSTRPCLGSYKRWDG